MAPDIGQRLPKVPKSWALPNPQPSCHHRCLPFEGLRDSRSSQVDQCLPSLCLYQDRPNRVGASSYSPRRYCLPPQGWHPRVHQDHSQNNPGTVYYYHHWSAKMCIAQLEGYKTMPASDYHICYQHWSAPQNYPEC